MKKIAITPNDFSFKSLVEKIAELKKQGTSHLYLRCPFSLNEVNIIFNKLVKMNIKLILPYNMFIETENYQIICNFREKDIYKFSIDNKFILPENLNKDKLIFSGSCHDYGKAVEFIDLKAEFVFVSPIFKPISKLNDLRPCFPLEKIKSLVTLFKDRIILLGGIDEDKLLYLKKNISEKFGIAGISMFFGLK